MTISQMHVWFRQYAQQMGMQNIRALLPEQIDLLINTSIDDIVNQIINQNISVTNDRVITDNTKIGQINALRTLYKVNNLRLLKAYKYSTTNTVDLGVGLLGTKTIDIRIDGFFEEDNSVTISHTFNLGDDNIDEVKDAINNKLAAFVIQGNSPVVTSITHTTDTSGGQVNDILHFTFNSNVTGAVIYSSTTVSFTPTSYMFYMTEDDIHKGKITGIDVITDYLYLVDFAIDYKTSEGLKIGSGDTRDAVTYTSNFTTTYFPIRILEDAFLADSLNDFILSPKLRSPVLTVTKSGFDLYFNEPKINKSNMALFENNLLPYTLRISYIEKPAKVKKASDINGVDVNCNLPDYLHEEILKHAVDLYRQSVSGSMLSQQGQDQMQQREIARNQAVPSNGYNNNNQ